MEIKRVHIAYFSPTGTTKRTLRAVAEGSAALSFPKRTGAIPKAAPQS